MARRLTSNLIAGQGALNEYNLVISTNQLSGYDVQTEAQGIGWDGISVTIVNVTINSGVQVGSTDLAIHGMDFGTFPNGSSLSLTILGSGNLNGVAGTLGVQGDNAGSDGANGGAGGVALFVRNPLDLTNNNEIWGGGGGGGGGGGCNISFGGCGSDVFLSGRDGGVGYGNTANTTSLSHKVVGPLSREYPSPTCTPCTMNYAHSGQGGDGGAKGTAGDNGENASESSGSCGDGTTGTGGTGGSSGAAIDGVSYVTKLVAGTITGPEIN